jgi:thioredoxin reductase (NADPH)
LPPNDAGISYSVESVIGTDENELGVELINHNEAEKTITLNFTEAIVDEIEGAVIVDAKTGAETKIYADGFFEAIGLAPENEQFVNLAELERGYIKSDERCLTKTPGIFTAGDCRTKSIRQIATAVADGAVAALAACDFIS